MPPLLAYQAGRFVQSQKAQMSTKMGKEDTMIDHKVSSLMYVANHASHRNSYCAPGRFQEQYADSDPINLKYHAESLTFSDAANAP